MTNLINKDKKAYTISTPDAAVVVYNYVDRKHAMDAVEIFGPRLPNPIKTDYQEVEITSSIMEISTTKEKSYPKGSFVIYMAPTVNWSSYLTTGSWLVIFMSPTIMARAGNDKKLDLEKNLKYIKMVGRIESIRVISAINQETHARETKYQIEGSDWGQIFETETLIHSLINSKGDSFIITKDKLGLNSTKDLKDKNKFLSTTADTIKSFLTIYGSEKFMEHIRNTNTGQDPLRLSPRSSYEIPESLAKIINADFKEAGNKLFDRILVKTGKLSGYDTYKDTNESYAAVNYADLIGAQNTLWQIMNAYHNDALNELFCDLRFEEDSDKPYFCLYNRIRPFCLGGAILDKSDKRIRDKLESNFFNVREHLIPTESILQVDCGTNWIDKPNFIEFVYDSNFVTSMGWKDINRMISFTDFAIYDKSGDTYIREGFRPMQFAVKHCDEDADKGQQWSSIANWRYFLAEWYFNLHKVLNGSINIVNLPTDKLYEYISVGDNIVIDPEVFFDTRYSKLQDEKKGKNSKILAHIEGVTNVFSVNNDNGAKSFTTNITFVRGVFVNEDRLSLLDPGMFGIETINTNNTNDLDHKNVIEDFKK